MPVLLWLLLLVLATLQPACVQGGKTAGGRESTLQQHQHTVPPGHSHLADLCIARSQAHSDDWALQIIDLPALRQHCNRADNQTVLLACAACIHAASATNSFNQRHRQDARPDLTAHLARECIACLGSRDKMLADPQGLALKAAVVRLAQAQLRGETLVPRADTIGCTNLFPPPRGGCYRHFNDVVEGLGVCSSSSSCKSSFGGTNCFNWLACVSAAAQAARANQQQQQQEHTITAATNADDGAADSYLHAQQCLSRLNSAPAAAAAGGLDKRVEVFRHWWIVSSVISTRLWA